MAVYVLRPYERVVNGRPKVTERSGSPGQRARRKLRWPGFSRGGRKSDSLTAFEHGGQRCGGVALLRSVCGGRRVRGVTAFSAVRGRHLPPPRNFCPKPHQLFLLTSPISKTSTSTLHPVRITASIQLRIQLTPAQSLLQFLVIATSTFRKHKHHG